jgi:hypothetical protein
MEDNRIDVLDRLAAADPVRSAPEFDEARVDRVLAAILAEPRSVPAMRRRPRRVVAVVVAVIVVGIAAPALALNESVRSFFGFQNPAVLEQSRLLVSAPVAEGTVARLWDSPSRNGGECSFVTFGPPGPQEHATEQGGGVCSNRPADTGIDPAALSVSVGKRPLKPRGATTWVPPLISGGLGASLGATRVEVHWNGGSKELAFTNGHYLGAVEELYDVPAELLPIFLVAYDKDDREVMRRQLDAAYFRLD